MQKLIPLIAAITLALPAAAQNAAIDINADGRYSFAEVQAALPDLSEDTFAAIDANGDGFLDASEIAAGVAAGLMPN
jgi:hypothetical protein